MRIQAIVALSLICASGAHAQAKVTIKAPACPLTTGGTPVLILFTPEPVCVTLGPGFSIVQGVLTVNVPAPPPQTLTVPSEIFEQVQIGTLPPLQTTLDYTLKFTPVVNTLVWIVVGNQSSFTDYFTAPAGKALHFDLPSLRSIDSSITIVYKTWEIPPAPAGVKPIALLPPIQLHNPVRKDYALAAYTETMLNLLGHRNVDFFLGTVATPENPPAPPAPPKELATIQLHDPIYRNWGLDAFVLNGLSMTGHNIIGFTLR